MLRALLFLRLTSAKNLLRSRVLRLRQPKYFAGAIAGVAYFWFFFFRHLAGAAHPGPMPAGAFGAMPAPTEWAAVGALALLVVFLLSWILPGNHPGLGFTEAEIAFLFPAPVSRRTLIHFKLASSQLRIFFTAFFFALISSRWTFLHGSAVLHAIGWWVILSATSLHYTGATLTITRLRDAGRSAAWRRGVVLGGVALLAVASWLRARHVLPVPGVRDLAGPHAFLVYLEPLTGHGWWTVLLWPGKILVLPFLAPDLRTFLPAFGLALLLLGALYGWVARIDSAFEEDSIARAEKRAKLVADARAGKMRFGGEVAKARREPFRLDRRGRPEFAFLWKNLLSTRPYFSLRVFLGAAGAIVALHLVLQHTENYPAFSPVLGVFALIVAAYTLFLGPQLARQDLRSDLGHSDLLKTYPIAGAQLVLGQLLTPTLILSGLIWLACLEWTLTFQFDRFPWLDLPLRATLALCVAAIAVPLTMLQVLVPNAATILFPAWFQAMRGAPGGIDVMGQRLIFVFGQMITTLLALLPAVILAGLALVCTSGWHYLLRGAEARLISPMELLTATATALIVLTAELWGGVWWLGRRFERFDLSTELRS